MADIFDEVDEELRQERAASLWRKYGSWLIAAALAIVLAVGGYKYWGYYSQNQQVLAADRYVAALTGLAGDDGDRTGAIGALDAIAEKQSDGYADLARLRAAGAKLANGDKDGAIAAYELIANNQDSRPSLRDLATLLAVSASLDDGDLDELAARLEPLAAAGQAWRPLAIELQGALALKSGDIDAARTLFEALVGDAATPENLRERAMQILQAFPQK